MKKRRGARGKYSGFHWRGKKDPSGMKPRPCLGICGKMYERSTPGNRICPVCAKREQMAEKSSAYDDETPRGPRRNCC